MVLILFFSIILDDFSFLIAIHLPIVLLFSHQSLLFVLKHFLSLLSLFLSFLFIHSYSHIFMSLSAHLSFLDLCFAAVPFPKHQFSLLLPKLTQYVLCIFFLHYFLPIHTNPFLRWECLSNSLNTTPFAPTHILLPLFVFILLFCSLFLFLFFLFLFAILLCFPASLLGMKQLNHINTTDKKNLFTNPSNLLTRITFIVSLISAQSSCSSLLGLVCNTHSFSDTCWISLSSFHDLSFFFQNKKNSLTCSISVVCLTSALRASYIPSPSYWLCNFSLSLCSPHFSNHLLLSVFCWE